MSNVAAVKTAITLLNRASLIRIDPVEAPKDAVAVMQRTRVLIRRMNVTSHPSPGVVIVSNTSADAGDGNTNNPSSNTNDINVVLT